MGSRTVFLSSLSVINNGKMLLARSVRVLRRGFTICEPKLYTPVIINVAINALLACLDEETLLSNVINTHTNFSIDFHQKRFVCNAVSTKYLTILLLSKSRNDQRVGDFDLCGYAATLMSFVHYQKSALHFYQTKTVYFVVRFFSG